ncbi:hypothetical protein [Cellulomonas sp. URHB0016]
MSIHDETHATDGPTPEEARQLLNASAGAAGALRAAGQNRHAQWLTGLATSTFMFYVALASGPDDTFALLLIGSYAATCATLWFSLVRGAPVTKRDMGTRWDPAIRLWGLAYIVTLIVGLTWLRDSSLFWLLSAVVVTAPLAVGAFREGRA